MNRKMRWLCVAAIMPAMASAQFDFGGGATSSKPWQEFHLNPKTRIQLDFHSGATWDAIVNFFEKQSGVTIVKDPTLTGTTSLTSARAVPLSDAFQILSTTLSLKGYSLDKQGNLLVIKGGQGGRGGGPGGGPGGNPTFQFPTQEQNPQTEAKVYKIVYANASQLAQVINNVYQPPANGGFQFQRGGFPGGAVRFGGGGPGGGGGRFGGGNFQMNLGGGNNQNYQLRAASDDFSNSVIVNATPADQIQVKELIDQLDKPSDLPQHTKTYHLTYEPASDAATIIQNVLTANVPRGRAGATSSQSQGPQAFFNAIRGTTAGAGQVVPDTRTNSVIVSAADEDLKIIDQVVLDIDKPITTQSTTFVFPLNNARADSIANLLQNAFGTPQGVTAPNSQTQNTYNGSIGNTSGGTQRSVSNSVNSQSGARAGTGLQGNQMQPDPSAAQFAMTPTMEEAALLKAAGQAYLATPPTEDQQLAMLAQGQNSLPLQLADPNAQNGELLTSIGVTQGFPGGGGGGIFRAIQGGGTQGGSAGGTSYGTTRLPNGQVVNTAQLQGQVTAVPDLNTNSLIVVTTPEDAAIIKKMLETLDQIPRQVEIQTIIVEATLDASSKLGVEWSFAHGLGGFSGDHSATGTGATSLGAHDTQTSGTNINLPSGFTYTIASKNLQFYLDALKSDSKFQVLATPRIITTNNVQAQINVSQSLPYVSSVQTDAAGNPTYSYQFLNVGIILTIQPRILNNGLVTLDIDQTANELQAYQSVGNTQAPVVNQREAQSTITVKDGETTILGGMIEKRVVSNVNKVPLLGDIPILGNLFRTTTKDNLKTELLVFLTPHVVLNPDDTKKLTNDTIKEMGPDEQKDLKDLQKKGTPEKTGATGTSNDKGNGG